jgi:Asp-tRNA(Asn)/Glu-tRNA(Gln) amidotransferase A subunit family amidase
MKDCMSTIGFAYLSHKREEDAACVVAAVNAGGIPLVRGNVPSGGLSIHASNNVWGTAVNIYNKDRSCGGSSGGDGGLVSSNCVPIAIGTDIGGSIRMPAHINGITGFKATGFRVS